MRGRMSLAGAGLVLLVVLMAHPEAAPVRTAATTSSTVTAVADTYVDSSSAGTGHGSSTVLRVGTTPTQDSLVRFNVPAGTVTAATLRIHNNGGATGGVQAHTAGAFTEATTYNTRPSIAATAIAYSGPYSANANVTIDVTSAVKGGQAVSLGLITTGSESDFSSREGSTPPQLVVVFSAVPTPTPTPTPRPTATPTPTPPPSTGLRVAGNTLMYNGSAFVPIGFNMIGLLTPPGCNNGGGKSAHLHLDQAEMNAAKAWHANTLRFQISQSGLVGSQSATYLNEIRAGVTLIHNNGFVIILSMQDQSIGCGPAHPLPTSQTTAAWRVLAPVFANVPYVMYEMFNEPQNDTTAAAWAQWKNGGSSPEPNQGSASVGHQSLVTTIRGTGANNVLLADGGRFAERLMGIPMLADTSSGKGIAYAVHPYYFTPGQSFWDQQYGYLTATVPVIATEWNYHDVDCGTNQESMTPAFFAYLKAHHIGMTAHAFDVPGILTTGWTYAPTQCGTANGGPGKVLQNWYAAH